MLRLLTGRWQWNWDAQPGSLTTSPQSARSPAAALWGNEANAFDHKENGLFFRGIRPGSEGGCPRGSVGVRGGIFLSALSAEGASPREGVPRLLLRTGTLSSNGSNQPLTGGAAVGPHHTDTSTGGDDSQRASQKQMMAQFSWRREGIDGGEFGPPGLCPWGKGTSLAVSRMEGKFPFSTCQSSLFRVCAHGVPSAR